MWISFAKISSFTFGEHLGSSYGMIGEVLKMITEALQSIRQSEHYVAN